MPRLPTMRVIGSQDISTRFRDGAAPLRSGAVTVAMSPSTRLAATRSGALGTRAPLRVAAKRSIVPASRGVVSGGELPAAVAPARLLVDGVVGQGPQVADDAAVD